MVSIGEQGSDILTKLHKGLADISYTINEEEGDDAEDDDDEDEDEDDDDVPKAPAGDAALARKLARDAEAAGRKSSRLAKHAESAQDVQEGAAIRERKQISLMKRRNEERLQELARASRKNGNDGGSDKPEEIETYRRTRDYPDNIQPNQVKVDMANQCVILPICGNPVPFHISTIKNVVLPDPDNATYLRINFYTAGMAVGKDAPENTAKLVAKYAPYATFIREMTFRSLDSHNLTHAFRQISELRKRARTRELRMQEEANLVEQEKLVRTKNERVPRLSDLTMRPVVAGRKTQGNLEAHSNGLRFISTRSEVVDIMYSNVKYAIFQPCENEIMVLIHFHLKNAIMVGKKRQFDVQFFTEVVDASQTVDAGRRSMYDPDEMDDEQRERQLRKKLNSAFRDFCKKVDAVAKKNNYNLEFDIPYRDLGFIGNPHKEMVAIQPTLNCLVNLTETPFFVVDLADIDHVHFERVTYMSKAFDMVLINKDFTKQPWRIDMIENADKDAIQDWLTDMEITYTQGPMNLNWKQIIQTVAADDRFYMNTEEDEVTEKEAGWEFLRLYGHDDDDEDDEEEDDSGYSEAPGEEDEEEEEESEEEEDFDSEDDDEEDFDADEELEEQGMDWEDMEKQAIMDDRRGRTEEEASPARVDKKRRSSQQQQPRHGASKQRRR
jgi:nucleosome binding factor SPN SPT16 subunit